jgi:hypothetical protein
MTGKVVERRFEGRAVRHDESPYYCLATTAEGRPCRIRTRWFYLPRNSHLCSVHMRAHENRGAT